MDFSAHCQILSVEANLKFKFLILSTIGKCPHLLKWVIVRIAAYFCASLSQIWIPEIEYYQKVSSNAQIGPLKAKKQQRT